GDGGSERVGAAELVRRLLPSARRGLVEAGVDSGEADRLLGVLGDRVDTGQTGASWQRRTLAVLEEKTDRDQALSELLERYLELQAGGEPVHTWPVEG
ncbi:MAG TPA: glutamate--cysteine ligase, partial [Actinomycetes bacterium]|nr:glutamate--cysteine ligase [Actinomycetes bacterium]